MEPFCLTSLHKPGVTSTVSHADVCPGPFGILWVLSESQSQWVKTNKCKMNLEKGTQTMVSCLIIL